MVFNVFKSGVVEGLLTWICTESMHLLFTLTCIVLQCLSLQCPQALGVCSHSDRSALKKKLKEIKKSEEKGQGKGEKRLKEEKEKERNVVLLKESEEKDKAELTIEGKSVKDGRRSGKTVRTESLL